MGRLQLRLSGTFDARIDATPIKKFRTVKARALLAYLALEPNIPHPRAALSVLLWPELSEKAAAANLRNTLSNFRRLFADIPDLLTITRQTVELHADQIWVDMRLFAENRSAETIDLYQGDFLPGFSFPDALPFEEWRTMQQERLHLLALMTFDRLIDEKVAAGELLSAMGLARRQLDLEPWHEKAHYQLIRLLWEVGQRETALQQYAQCQTILAEELGIEPSAELQRLVAEIRQPNLPLAPPTTQAENRPVKENLPLQNHLFVGREVEIESLMHALKSGESRLITLLGIGGVGKSRLALEVAGRLVEQGSLFRDGIFFVRLAPLDDPENIPLAVGEAIGYSFYEGEPFRDQLFQYLGERHMLLLFDNFEHLAQKGVRFIRDMLRVVPYCRLLVTSRQTLNIGEETVVQLGGLPHAVAGHDGEGLGPAERLFLLSAKRVRSDYTPSEPELVAIHKICRLVDGLPLAIVLAAAWAGTLSAAEIGDEIERDLDFLETERIDLPPRQRSMRATFAHTWRLLAPDERAAYAKLSVFRGGFTRTAADAVTGASLRLLARFVSKSLLSYDPQRNRYFIHTLLRQIAEIELKDLGEVLGRQVRDAHLVYYQQGMVAREVRFRDERQQTTIEEIAAEFANVRAAWRWAVDTKHIGLLSEMLEPLFLFYFSSGREQDGVAEFERALHHLPDFGSEPVDHPRTLLQARLKNRLFELTHLYRVPDGSEVDTLRTIFAANGAEIEAAILMHREGMIALRAGDLPGGISLFQQQVDIHRRSGNNFRLCAALTNLAQLYYIAGLTDAGRTVTEEALQIGRTYGDRLSIALSLIILGAAELFWQGDIETARLRCQQVEEIGQKIRSSGQVVTGFILAKSYLCFIALLQNELETAAEYLEQVRVLWVEKKTPLVNGMVFGIESLWALAHGRYAEALEKGNRGLSYSTRAGAVELNQIALVTAACTLHETAHARSILAPLWEAIVKGQQLPERSLLFYLVPAMAHILLEDGQPELAASLLQAARSHKFWPGQFLDRLELTQLVEAECIDRLGENRFKHAGESAAFGDITAQALAAVQQSDQLLAA